MNGISRNPVPRGYLRLNTGVCVCRHPQIESSADTRKQEPIDPIFLVKPSSEDDVTGVGEIADHDVVLHGCAVIAHHGIVDRAGSRRCATLPAGGHTSPMVAISPNRFLAARLPANRWSGSKKPMKPPQELPGDLRFTFPHKTYFPAEFPELPAVVFITPLIPRQLRLPILNP